MSEALRPALALLLAVAFVLYFDRRARALGLEPPGFADRTRRLLGSGALAVGLAVCALSPLAAIGAEVVETDFAQVPTWVCESIMPVAFSVIGLRYLLLALTTPWNPHPHGDSTVPYPEEDAS